MKNRFLQGSLVGLLSALAALMLHQAKLLTWIENPLWSVRAQRMQQPGTHTGRIKLILIDQASINWGRENNGWPWPWPRTVHAAVVSFCRRGEARTTVMDVTFTENSRHGVDDDEALGSTIAESPNLTMACFAGKGTGGMFEKWPPFASTAPLNVSNETSHAGTASSNLLVLSADFPVPEIASNTHHFGNVFTLTEKDDVIRRTEPFFIFDGRFLPSLGLSAYLSAHPDASIVPGHDRLKVDGYTIPLDQLNRTILKFRGPVNAFECISAAAVIQSEIQIINGETPALDPAVFKDCYVFYGSSATALFDIKATPVSSIFPGVAIHATFLDNLLSNDFIKDASLIHILISALVFGLIAGIAGRHCVTGLQLAVAYILIIPLSIIPSFIAYRLNIWEPVSVNLASCTLALVSVSIVNYALEGRQKKFIKQAFRQYLSPIVIDKLLLKPDSLTLGGETRELTIFFSDVQGFTSISESLSPHDLTSLLNTYLSAMTDIILDEGGTVDKYEGDAIIAFWNAPLSQHDHPLRAVRSALLCQKKLAELRPAFREKVHRDLFARIGLNTGEVVVGNMGSSKRFDYTFLGDAGNLASRLEGINKVFGTYIMISEATKNRLGSHFMCREISRVRVVGKDIPVTVYEPYLPEDFTARKETLDRFDQGLRAFYRGDLKEALAIFQSITQVDAPARAYAAKCTELLTNPPPQWDGVWQMTEK